MTDKETRICSCRGEVDQFEGREDVGRCKKCGTLWEYFPRCIRQVLRDRAAELGLEWSERA